MKIEVFGSIGLVQPAIASTGRSIIPVTNDQFSLPAESVAAAPDDVERPTERKASRLDKTQLHYLT